MSSFKKLKKLSPWRKLALVTWKRPQESTVYGQFDFDATAILSRMESLKQQTGENITLTHLITKAAALTLAQHPALNGIIKWGTIYLRDTVDIILQVAVPQHDEPMRDHLSAAKICQADQKTVAEIAAELSKNAQDIRQGKNDAFDKTFDMAKRLPVFVLRFLIGIHEFLVFNLGISIPALGLKPDPFGSLMITSVGSLGLPPGLAPLVPPSRCPLILCLGAVQNKPWVVGEHIEIRPVVGISFTFDHRFIDGFMASRMFKTFQELIANPEKIL